MVRTSVNKVPIDIKGIVFRQFISFEGFTVSRETANHITVENIITMVRTSVDIFDPPIRANLWNTNSLFYFNIVIVVFSVNS